MIGLFKTELIKPRGPWRTPGQVEIATLHYNACWRSHAITGYPPAPGTLSAPMSWLPACHGGPGDAASTAPGPATASGK